MRAKHEIIKIGYYRRKKWKKYFIFTKSFIYNEKENKSQ